MPDKSQKQHNFMAGIAHGMKPRNGKSGPSPEVAREFLEADKAQRLYQGPRKKKR